MSAKAEQRRVIDDNRPPITDSKPIGGVTGARSRPGRSGLPLFALEKRYACPKCYPSACARRGSVTLQGV